MADTAQSLTAGPKDLVEMLGVMNAAMRRLDVMFPGYFDAAKHNHYADFGYPTTLTFPQLYAMYQRNGIARAGVDKTIIKTWQDHPFLLEKERDGSQGASSDETPLEAQIRKRFDTLRFWPKIADADRRGLVGRYSGLIMRLADGKSFDQPVETVRGGLDGLVELIPAWEGQLLASEWDGDPASPTYGQPKKFQFNESNFDQNRTQARQLTIHPDRVIIWSRDGTVFGESLLEPGYNDLLDMEKIRGAGGEGFWKNAKSAPVLQVDKDAKLDAMAKLLGISMDQLADKMNAQVDDWQKGFDKLLMIQGMEAKTLGITLQSPEHFFLIALQGFAASIQMPLKIIIGSQTGERASTEDAAEWSQTSNARRQNTVKPNLMDLVGRLVRFRILPERDWFLDWSDLTEASMAEKIDRADKMAGVNLKMAQSGSPEIVFTPDEIREVVDLEPLSDAEKYVDEGADGSAVTPPANPAPAQPPKDTNQ